MRGDSLRDLYAKALAVVGLGLLAGVGALVNYWPVPAEVPTAASVLAAPPGPGPLAPRDAIIEVQTLAAAVESRRLAPNVVGEPDDAVTPVVDDTDVALAGADRDGAAVEFSLRLSPPEPPAPAAVEVPLPPPPALLFPEAPAPAQNESLLASVGKPFGKIGKGMANGFTAAGRTVGHWIKGIGHLF